MDQLPAAGALAAAYDRDGVVCVRSVLDPAEVAAAEGAVQ